MAKTEKGNNRKLREYLSSFAEVAECLNELDVPLEGLEVIVKVTPRIHNEIQEEISNIGRLTVEKNETFTVNISEKKFTFIK
jgi:predicted DNA-binding ArsR family transcriptional regulator